MEIACILEAVQSFSPDTEKRLQLHQFRVPHIMPIAVNANKGWCSVFATVHASTPTFINALRTALLTFVRVDMSSSYLDIAYKL